MSGHRKNQTPIVRFLGDDAGQGGPFALLGLRHEIGSDSEIHRARLRRLRQVDCHPQRTTPDAEEVRLAIHSAATQLLDQELRAELAIRWPEGTPVDLPKAWSATRAMHRVTPALLRRARLIVGSSGGWNARARRRLAHLARVNRLSAIEVVRNLGSNTRSGASHSKEHPRTLPSLPEPPDGRSWYLIYAILGAVACLTAVTLFVAPGPPTTHSGESDTIQLDDYSDSTDTPDIEGRVIRDRLTHYTAIAHELDRLVARATVEPTAAIARFREIYPQFLSDWIAFPRAALQRAGVNTAEFVVRLDEQGIPPEEITPLLAVAGTDPDRVMLAVAAIDFTLSSAGLRQETLDQLRAIRGQISNAPSTTNNDLINSVQLVASHLANTSETDTLAWWEDWHAGAEHAAEKGSPEHTSIMLDALSNRLRDPKSANEDWRSVASLLVRSLDWRVGSAERYWLIEQFSDSDVQTPRLAMLTDALVTESAAEGVNQLMILRQDANLPKREQIQTRFQEAWFPNRSVSQSGEPPSGSTTPIMNQLRVEINATPDLLSDDQAIESTLRLSRLVTAACLQLDGSPELSEEVIAEYDAPLQVGERVQSSLAMTDADTVWAEKVVNTTEPEQLRPYLDELIGANTVGISSAYALVHLANRANAEVRQLALQQITRFGDQMTILIAIDHALPSRSSRPSSKIDAVVDAALQTELPSRNSSDWIPTVRRELLARMGRALADDRALRVSRLQEELVELHMLRLDMLGMKLSRASSPNDLLAELIEHERVEFELSLISAHNRSALEVARTQATIDRVRAQSSLHRYAAEQRYWLNLKRVRLVSRFPDTERMLGLITEEFHDRDSKAKSVLHQIAQTQRAIAQLTLIELEREQTP